MTDSPTIGHNSVAGKELLAAIERIERHEETRRDIAGDVKAEFDALKSKGFNIKVVRKMLRFRAMDKEKRDEELALTETYLHACGLV